ncbi:MAG: ABC transporter ATP-binding protein [Thermoplasmata archaeon]|nr:MAG: ABC transporter ATP-binding protein [Thermoplasmata archaeon]
MNAIDVKNLTKVYREFRMPDVVALDSVTFGVAYGDIYGFLGPNGAGKTTTINILAGIIMPTSGEAWIDGHNVVDESDEVKNVVGILPEKPGFYETLNGYEVLDYYGALNGIPREERRKRIKELMEELGLAQYRKMRVKAYSHGMRKRLALAQALLHEPKITIMDEPTNGLDPAGIVYFRRLIKRLNREGITIFLSSHILSEVELLCNSVGIINRGKMVITGNVGDVKKKLKISRSKYIMLGEITKDFVSEALNTKGVLDVRQINSGYEIILDPEVSPCPDLVRMAVEQGCKITSFYSYEPTLEEIFLEMTGSDDGGEKGV